MNEKGHLYPDVYRVPYINTYEYKFSLLEKAEEIKEQQGFIKNTEDIKTVIKYIDRSFVPRKLLSDPKLFKAANKLLCSLKLYIFKKFEGESNFFRYKNIFHDYHFINNELKPLTEILQVNDNSGELNQLCSYRMKDLNFNPPLVDKERAYNSFIKRRIVIQKFTHGKKEVKKDIFVNFKLKKTYNSKESLNKDLYQCYLHWLESKKRANIVYTDVALIHRLEGIVHRADMPTIKYHKKYYLSEERFEHYLEADNKEIPKRFFRIIRFCRHIKAQKAIRLDTVSESLLCEVDKTKNIDKNDNFFKKQNIKDIYKFKMNAKFAVWFNAITYDLYKKGYLSHFVEIQAFPPHLKKGMIQPFPQALKSKIIKKVWKQYCGIPLDYPDDTYFRQCNKLLKKAKTEIKTILKLRYGDLKGIINDLKLKGYLNDEDFVIPKLESSEVKNMSDAEVDYWLEKQLGNKWFTDNPRSELYLRNNYTSVLKNHQNKHKCEDPHLCKETLKQWQIILKELKEFKFNKNDIREIKRELDVNLKFVRNKDFF